LQIVSVDFDTTLCSTTKCRNLVFRNVGTDPLTLTNVDTLQAPFAGSISPLPQTIQPDQERTFTVCYEPQMPDVVDTLEVGVVADNRVSLSIATLFDVSGSMVQSFGTTTRIQAAHDAGRSFLSNLVNDSARGVIDEGAVYQFASDAEFQRRAGYTTNLAILRNSVPINAPGPSTCLFDAIVRVTQQLETRNQPGRRVLVVLADGDNSCSAGTTIDDAINAAQSAGIRIYTIGIGAANSADLEKIADSTGGFYSEALSPSELLESYQNIANSLSRNQASSFVLRGESVAPQLSLSQSAMTFDSTRVGNSVCLTLEVGNTGTAPLQLGSIIAPGNSFQIDPVTLPTIEPNAQFGIEICFAPRTIREIDSELLFNYTRCEQRTDTVRLHGVGYDSVTLVFEGDRNARPGSIVHYPLELEGPIPDEYAVDSLSLVFRYNKTMLYPEPESSPVPGSEGLLRPFGEVSTEQQFGRDSVMLTVSLENGRLVSNSVTGNLGEIAFLVLHGNSLVTPVELMGAKLADGNPRVGIVTDASFSADSLCFQERRLIDATERIGMIARYVPGVSNDAVLSIDAPETGLLTIDVFDQVGRRIVHKRVDAQSGLNVVRLDMSQWSEGIFYVRSTMQTNESPLHGITTIRRMR
jgi:hypothetical protein